MKKRLIEFLAYLGIGQTKFEEMTGLSRGLISAIKSDNITITSVNKIIAKYPELNVDWLLTGKGGMLRQNVIDRSVTQIGDGNNINAVGKNTIDLGSEALAQEIQMQKNRIKELEILVEELRKDKQFLQELLMQRKNNDNLKY